ncbi:hypothetical protein RCH07_001422 [Arthrobacter sp. CG_A4]|nr:hypothetical protein [Arthrobacter sp. CG_A4]
MSHGNQTRSHSQARDMPILRTKQCAQWHYVHPPGRAEDMSHGNQNRSHSQARDMPILRTKQCAQWHYVHPNAPAEDMSSRAQAQKRDTYASDRCAMVAVALRSASCGTSRMISSRKQ